MLVVIVNYGALPAAALHPFITATLLALQPSYLVIVFKPCSALNSTTLICTAQHFNTSTNYIVLHTKSPAYLCSIDKFISLQNFYKLFIKLTGYSTFVFSCIKIFWIWPGPLKDQAKDFVFFGHRFLESTYLG